MPVEKYNPLSSLKSPLLRACKAKLFWASEYEYPKFNVLILSKPKSLRYLSVEPDSNFGVNINLFFLFLIKFLNEGGLDDYDLYK